MPTAIITGASQGLGRALAADLAHRGWRIIADARTSADLSEAVQEWPGALAIPGDITDPTHRAELAAAAGGRIDALILNASSLGQTPLPSLSAYDLGELRQVFEVNVIAAVGLIQQALPGLHAASGRILAISSDAAVEGYPGWGGYGASKAAVDQLARVLAAEEPALRVYAADPGDMRTAMQAAAFPGEDISDRPEPGTAVPGLRRLLTEDLPSGRYTASALAEGLVTAR
jgi:NAD(P)-dependent dehydrogenase (short-subunit alcohol dehydrogenase family)